MILRTTQATYGTSLVRLTVELTSQEPPLLNTVTAHCVGFAADGRVLLSRHVDR